MFDYKPHEIFQRAEKTHLHFVIECKQKIEGIQKY
jgi:hypothetical protein